MELILQKDLPHQQKAVEAVCNVLKGATISSPSFYYQNPLIDIYDSIIKKNIAEIQKTVRPEIRGSNDINDFLNLDIKMETGTGKTYVYTKTIYEMHKMYGINKFIIVVPNLPIKAGIKQFIEDPYVKRHFKDVCGYNCEIELGVLESVNKRKGKSYFPSVVREFVKGSYQISNKIYVLLTNMQLLTNGNMLSREDYDYGVEGFYRPLDALKSTHPIVILDEPHRFTKGQKAWQTITKELAPQCLVRYGATFPESTTGRGKNRITVKDYHNLLYDLNAFDSFNQNLIKGVTKEHFEPLSKRDEKVKITTINSRASAILHYYKKGESTKIFAFSKDDSLSRISHSFNGLKITAIGKNYLELSNGQTKYQGEEFSTDVYSTSYQEQMLRLALERHFETERVNFNRKNKIKTIALFFIDDIYSYRNNPNSEKEPYLKNFFERLLLERIDVELSNISEYESDYKEYLIASKNNISACHSGYFSHDNSDSDEEINKEVKEILYEKKQLLSFHNLDGIYNTRRFLFSKWTLKEGWDNPNVFTIAKLRSSGSENSKLQEVGRGLRLPVDEFGNRISNEEFKLNYIVDFTEADFAQKLAEQINNELPNIYHIDEKVLKSIAKKLSLDEDNLFLDLLSKNYIDRNYNIKLENREKFFEEYPDFNSEVKSGKIVDNNIQKQPPIKIRKDVYSELKDLWEAINQRYLLYYDNNINHDLTHAIQDILEKSTFNKVVISSSRNIITSDGNRMITSQGTGVQYAIDKPIAYSEFLKSINRQTNIPINTMHQAIIAYHKSNGGLDSNFINEYSAANFVIKFNEWKSENLAGRFKYKRANLSVGSTALTNIDGSPKNEIVQGRIGTKIIAGEPSKKYLYDVIAFDSPLERENITTNIEEIIVYGKIPRNSISIPTITGGTYSPDFMYVVKKDSGEKELNVIIETKDVENKTSLRGIEQAKINCAEEFFKQLKNDGYKVTFQKQINNKKIKTIIDEVLNSSI
ncbi:type III restriction-modification system endonuclease [Bacillus pumilus]|uniref:type III restriction-modification system endonuclease n=1 Tax=Bacillus pumilus TaxID=1408 RepID=UPI0034D6EF69